MENLLTNKTASISELRKPMDILKNSDGEAVAILNRNKVAFYALPAEFYEKILDMIDDVELQKIALQRKDEETVEVNIDDYL